MDLAKVHQALALLASMGPRLVNRGNEEWPGYRADDALSFNGAAIS